MDSVAVDVFETDSKCVVVRAQFFPSYQLASSPLRANVIAANLTTHRNLRRSRNSQLSLARRFFSYLQQPTTVPYPELAWF